MIEPYTLWLYPSYPKAKFYSPFPHTLSVKNAWTAKSDKIIDKKITFIKRFYLTEK